MARKPVSQIDAVLNLYKRRSETPLQTIERYVSAHPEYNGSKMTYAGRLDPMAEGVLVVLSGEKNKERETYTGLDKEYEFEFMLGVETDTHDILGRIVSSKTSGVAESGVKAALSKYQGTFSQRYPAYSSKVVDGTPLYELARKGMLAGVAFPEHEVRVSGLEFIGSREISRDEFSKFTEETIGKVKGDFRQKEILGDWKRYFEASPDSFVIYKARVECGSGFYVRQLVSDMGKDLGTGAVTVSILRTRVGEYTIEKSEK